MVIKEPKKTDNMTEQELNLKKQNLNSSLSDLSMEQQDTPSNYNLENMRYQMQFLEPVKEDELPVAIEQS